MIRTIFISILMMAVSSLAAQDKQRQVEAQQRLMDIAKEVWKCFPTECFLTSMGDLRLFMFDIKAPKERFRPSLLDSLNVAFAEAVPTATYASVMKCGDKYFDEDTVSYTLTWDKIEPNRTVLQPALMDRHYLPSTTEAVSKKAYIHYNTEVCFDNYNDSISLHVWLHRKNELKGHYDIAGFDSLLAEVKSKYPSTRQKVKFPDDPSSKGEKYVITCNADSVLQVLSQYAIQNYWYEDRPMIAIDYILEWNDVVQAQELYLYLFTSEHRFCDRLIELVVCGGKLLLLDLENQHDYEYPEKFISSNSYSLSFYPPMDWIKILEPELYQRDLEERLARRNAPKPTPPQRPTYLSDWEEAKRTEYLTQKAKEVMLTFGPDWYQEPMKVNISELKEFDIHLMGKDEITEPLFGRKYYTVTFRYDRKKEHDWTYAAEVDIWEDDGEPWSIMFGNNWGNNFLSRSYKQCIEEGVKDEYLHQYEDLGEIYKEIQDQIHVR